MAIDAAPRLTSLALPQVALPPSPRKHTSKSMDVDRMYLSVEFGGTELHLGMMTKIDTERDTGCRLTAEEARSPKAKDLLAVRLVANAKLYEDERRNAEYIRSMFVDAARRHAATLHALGQQAIREYDAQPGPIWTRERAKGAEQVVYAMGKGLTFTARREVLRKGGDTLTSTLTKGERTSAPFVISLARWRTDVLDHNRPRKWDDLTPVARDPQERWSQWLSAMVSELQGKAHDPWGDEDDAPRTGVASGLFKELLYRAQIGKDVTTWSPFLRGAVSLGGAGSVNQYWATLTPSQGYGDPNPTWEGKIAPLGKREYDDGAYRFRIDPRNVGWPLDDLRMNALVDRAEAAAYEFSKVKSGFPRSAAMDLFHIAATPPNVKQVPPRR